MRRGGAYHVHGTETRNSEHGSVLCSSSFSGVHLPVSLEGKAGLLHFPCIKFTAHSLTKLEGAFAGTSKKMKCREGQLCDGSTMAMPELHQRTSL